MNLCKVKDLDDFQKLVGSAQMKYGKLKQTNFLFVGDLLNENIARGLWYQENPNGIVFIKKNLDVAEIYYMLNDEAKGIELNDQTLEVQVLTLEFFEKNDQALKIKKALCQQSGYKLVKTYLEMNLFKPQFIIGEQHAAVKVVSAQEGDMEEIQTLWKNHLAIDSHPIPDDETLRTALFNGEVKIIKKKDEVIAVMQIHMVYGSVLIERVVVSKKYQSHGYGKMLIESLFKDKSINKLKLFVDIENKRAISFYEKMHFQPSVKKLYQYKKEI